MPPQKLRDGYVAAEGPVLELTGKGGTDPYLRHISAPWMNTHARDRMSLLANPPILFWRLQSGQGVRADDWVGVRWQVSSSTWRDKPPVGTAVSVPIEGIWMAVATVAMDGGNDGVRGVRFRLDEKPGNAYTSLASGASDAFWAHSLTETFWLTPESSLEVEVLHTASTEVNVKAKIPRSQLTLWWLRADPNEYWKIDGRTGAQPAPLFPSAVGGPVAPPPTGDDEPPTVDIESPTSGELF